MTTAPQSFPATSWGSILAARDGTERAAHLDGLFRAYWGPVYLYVTRAWRKSDADARDLTQTFFVRLLETDFLKDVDPARGRFRTYIKACLRHFLLDERKHEQAQKRGGGQKLFSLDGLPSPSEPAAATPEEAFDTEWIYSLLRAAIPELERALSSMGRGICWDVFKRLDVDAAAGRRPTYGDVAQELKIGEQAVKSHADYARRMLRKLILAKVRDYTLDDADAQAELNELFPSEAG